MTAKKGYVNSVIELGERLLEAKEKVPFGQWEEWVKRNSEFRFDERQARKFMQIASNKLLVLEYFNNENSVNNLTKAISDASPEQLKNDFKDVFDYRQILHPMQDLSLFTSQKTNNLTAPMPKRKMNAPSHIEGRDWRLGIP